MRYVCIAFYEQRGHARFHFSFVCYIEVQNQMLLTLQASRGGEERCKPGRRSRGAKEASWGVSRGFLKRVKGRVRSEELRISLLTM